MKRIVNFSKKPLDAFAGLTMNASKPSTQRMKKENKRSTPRMVNPLLGNSTYVSTFFTGSLKHWRRPLLKETGYNIVTMLRSASYHFQYERSEGKEGYHHTFQVVLSIEEAVHIWIHPSRQGIHWRIESRKGTLIFVNMLTLSFQTETFIQV